MAAGAWTDRFRMTKLAEAPLPPAPWPTRPPALRALGYGLQAVGWPALFILAVGLPHELALLRATCAAAAVALLVLERLDEARARAQKADLAELARALGGDVATTPRECRLRRRPSSRRVRRRLLAPVPPTPPRPRRRPSVVVRLPLASAPRVVGAGPLVRRPTFDDALHALQATRARSRPDASRAPPSERTTVCERFEELRLRALSSDATIPEPLSEVSDDAIETRPPRRR